MSLLLLPLYYYLFDLFPTTTPGDQNKNKMSNLNQPEKTFEVNLRKMLNNGNEAKTDSKKKKSW